MASGSESGEGNSVIKIIDMPPSNIRLIDIPVGTVFYAHDTEWPRTLYVRTTGNVTGISPPHDIFSDPDVLFRNYTPVDVEVKVTAK